MKGREDIEAYLLRVGKPFSELGTNLWNLKDSGSENLLISIAGPVVVFRMKMMEIPDQRREALFELLLRLNTTDLVHGAFGIEDTAIVICHALELENLDFNEFQAVIDDMGLAVSKHYPTLSKFRS